MKALRILLLIGLVSAGCKPGPQVQWEPYSQESIDAALKSRKPAVIDFYAAWCGPCMEMKETTFRDPGVIEALEPFLRLKADMSFNRSEKIEKISNQYDINGLPTMIFFDASGNQERLTGFVSAERLLTMVNQFKQKHGIESLPAVENKAV